MIGVLEDNRAVIAQLCARHGMTRLEVFGSALRDDFLPGESDIDLLVEFGPLGPYERADAAAADEVHPSAVISRRVAAG